MESKAIERLLEKYMEAESTLQEENELRAYFSSGQVAPHLQEYAPMFTYFESSKAENFSGKVSFPSERRKVYSWVAVAASIVIMASVFIQDTTHTSELGTYEDPELAMQKTKEALNMVSQLMHSGTEDLGHLREFDRTKNKILK